MFDPRTIFRWYALPPVELLLYVLFRWIVLAVHAMPERGAMGMARWIGTFLWAVDVKHRRIAAKNIERAGLAQGEAAEAMIERVYRHLGLFTVEVLLIPRWLKRGEIPRRSVTEGMEGFDEIRRRGRPAIMVIGHLGNWDIPGIAIHLLGYRCHSVSRPMENRYVAAYINRIRRLTGQEIIFKHGAAKSMLEVMRRKGILVMFVDQNVRHDGVFVEFLGRPAATYRSPALLAFKYDAPIVPAEVWRDERGVHHYRASEPIDPASYRGLPDGMERMTAAYTKRIEEFVRRHPDQWLWLHARWKTQPKEGEKVYVHREMEEGARR